MTGSPLFGRGLGEALIIMNLYPKLIHDALATVRYPGTGKNLIEAEMVEDDLRIDGQKVSFSLIFEKPTDPFMKSILKSAEAAIKREAGADVLGIVSIFTYGMQKGLDRLAAANVKNVSLCDLDALVKVAAESGYIQDGDQERILKFRSNPSDESWIGGNK